MICAVTRGASPSDGSSSSSSRGRAISARPSDQHLPLAAGQRAGRRRGALGQAREQLVDLGQAVAPAAPAPQAAEPQVLLDGQLGDHTAALGHVGDPAAHDLLDRLPADVAPVERMRPARARTRPEIVRSSVVLPAPLAPSTAVMLPSATSKETPSSARHRAVGGARGSQRAASTSTPR